MPQRRRLRRTRAEWRCGCGSLSVRSFVRLNSSLSVSGDMQTEARIKFKLKVDGETWLYNKLSVTNRADLQATIDRENSSDKSLTSLHTLRQYIKLVV